MGRRRGAARCAAERAVARHADPVRFYHGRGCGIATRRHAIAAAPCGVGRDTGAAHDLARMRAQNMAMIPTLALFSQDEAIPAILDEVRQYSASGGQILFGTDAGFLADSDTAPES